MISETANNIKVSFVILEYKSLSDVENCVKSIRANMAGVSFEIIVSSNSCYEKRNQEEIQRRDAEIKWLFNERNGGFAYGMNRGLFISRGDYLVIVNPDITIIEGMRKMIDFMEKHPGVGAVGPAVVDNKGIIQDSCREYVTLPRFIIRHARRLISNSTVVYDRNMVYSTIQTVDWIIGAFIMVSRKAFFETNGFDEKYLFYAEDLDWCTRIRESGFEIVYFPETRVVFTGSRAARKLSRMSCIFIRSHLRYWFRNGFFFGHPARNVMKFSTET